MRITYRWAEVSEDGLLKEPRVKGPYDDERTMNPWGGYDSEEAAIEGAKAYWGNDRLGAAVVLLKFFESGGGK
jgi:hypothetical protein